MERDKLLWAITTIIAIAALIASSYYAVELYDFEKTCQGCIEANRCRTVLNPYLIVGLNQTDEPEFGPLASGYVFANET